MENNTNKDMLSVQFKEHREFFIQLYEYKNQYLQAYSLALLDFKLTTDAFSSLVRLINCGISQISKVLNKDDLNTKEKEIILHIQQKKYLEALNIMDNIFEIVSIALEKTDLAPQVKRDELDEITEFWQTEKHQAIKEMKKAFADVIFDEK